MGVATRATVFYVITTHRSPQDIVHYVFLDQYSGKQYQGKLIPKVGVYKKGDTLSIHYLKENPKRNTMEGAWKSNVFLWFTVALAMFVLYAVFKLYQEIQSGSL